MKYVLWCAIVFALIILFPIPLKITLIYDKGIFTLKLFNKTLIPLKEKKSKENKNKLQEDYIEAALGEKKAKFKLQNSTDIIKFLTDTKVKFSLRTKIHIEYSIEDAAVSAIAYGMIYQVMASVYNLLKCFFKVRRFKPSIKMKYNENFFKITITSIFIVNIVKIIYIIGFIYYAYIRKSESSTYETSI